MVKNMIRYISLAPFKWIVFCCAMIAAPHLLAEVTARTDRYEMYSDETLQLNVNVDSRSNINRADIESLQTLFDILEQRQYTSTSTTLNGQRTTSKVLQFRLRPKNTGILTIPAFRSGNEASQPIQITVYSAAKRPNKLPQDAVIISATLSEQTPYVKQPFVLTLEVAYNIEMQNAALEGLTFPAFDSVELNKGTTIETRSNKQYKVYRQVLQLTADQAGRYSLPDIVLSADYYNATSGQVERFSRAAQVGRIDVRAIPKNYPTNAIWLPVTSLTLEDNLDSNQSYQVGDYIDWLTLMTVEGAPATQLPDPLANIEAQLPTGVRLYRNPAEIDDSRRVDVSALSFTAAGSLRLPEIRIPWWNIDKDKLEWATLPARNMRVAAVSQNSNATNGLSPAPNQAVAIDSEQASSDETETETTTQKSFNFWKAIAILLAIAWPATVLYFIFIARKPVQKTTEQNNKTVDTDAEQSLARYAKQNDITGFYNELMTQMRAIELTEKQLINALDDDGVNAFETLNNYLFAEQRQQPDQDSLLLLAKKFRKLFKQYKANNRSKNKSKQQLFDL
ncbi:protein BatD [Reinekea thalattae]|uniref:Protein BatD n=2 Tax=Reinekea thalattae TaxID=2593301 RepID=A0A5C8ZAA2_9GAMM|nr:protein BatD [Reinekea thalattae]